MKLGIFVVGTLESARPLPVGAKHMVIHQDVIRAELFRASGKNLYGAGVGTDFVVGQDNTYFHVSSKGWLCVCVGLQLI
jgi:hypothetical protein